RSPRGVRGTACGAWSCAASASGIALRLALGGRLRCGLGRRHGGRLVDRRRLRLRGSLRLRCGRALARGPAALLPTATASAGAAALLDEPEALAVLAAAATALAGGAEPLAVRPAPPARAVGLGDALAAERALVALGHDLALVDPDLDADPSVRRLGLGEAVVDVRADRVQRDPALGVALAAAHLAAAEPSAALDLDPLRPGAHRPRERTFHRAPERDAVLQLLGDRLRDELRVQLRPLDLVDVDVDALTGDRVEVLAERVDLDAGLPAHDPGARGVDVHRHALLVLADQDVRQPGVRELAV